MWYNVYSRMVTRMENVMNQVVFSDLELLVINDMWDLGFDPTNIADVKYYWEIMLNGYNFIY